MSLQSDESPAAANKEETFSRTKVFEMYIDSAKWILAIIAGLLVFGIDHLKDHVGRGPAQIAFCISAVALSVSAASTLIYLIKSYTYASRRTSGEQSDERVASAYRSAGRAFKVLIWSFGIGLLAFGAFGLFELGDLMSSDESVSYRIGDGGGVIALKGEHVWRLSSDLQGRPDWVQLPGLPPPVADAVAAQQRTPTPLPQCCACLCRSDEREPASMQEGPSCASDQAGPRERGGRQTPDATSLSRSSTTAHASMRRHRRHSCHCAAMSD